MDSDDFDDLEPFRLAIDGILDLHTFSPKDLKTLIPEYLAQCHTLGIFEVRIIHGKGLGNLRRSVHALLDRSPLVEGYRLAGMDSGGWGATLVALRPYSSTEKTGGSIE